MSNLQSLLRAVDEEAAVDREAAAESLTFADYLEVLTRKPAISSLAHARIHNMIVSAGVDQSENTPAAYHFFDNELFGLESVSKQLVEEYFAPAAKRLDVRKRILLLVGPVGSGKSTIVTLLKRGLEQYSRTLFMYAIDGCPMVEEPLHLIPHTQRPLFVEQLGVQIEGDLCPLCQYRVDNPQESGWKSIADIKVTRKLLSEKSRTGIGTFKPADPKSQDVADLTGHVNLSALVDPQFRGESDPRAYRFDGELNVANRGLIEMIEMLKCEPRFLYELNTVCGEQRIKVPQFALVYADLVVVAHTNEYEFNRYFSEPANEAMIDRIFVVRVPYNLRVTEEVRIYKKLVSEANLTLESGRRTHIAPQTLRTVSLLAVLSRLKPSDKSGLSLLAKAKLYDGEQRVGDWEQKHLREIQQEGESKHEGMDGFSPRFIMNRLSSALIAGKTCINPLDAIRSLRDGIRSQNASNPKEAERLLTLLDEVRKELDELVKKTVQRAFVHAYAESCQTLLDNYLKNVDAFCSKTKLRDSVTDEEVPADEKLMQSIEEQIGVTGESKRKEFREGMMRSVASVAMRGQKFTLGSNNMLREAIEKKLFVDLRDTVKITTSIKTPDLEQQKKIDAVLARLTDPALPEEERYCSECASELLKYAGQLLSR